MLFLNLRCITGEADKMNLALIDPFQLAQDSPEALVDEFSKSASASMHPRAGRFVAKPITKISKIDFKQDLAMLLRSDSAGKATIWHQGEWMAKSSSGKSRSLDALFRYASSATCHTSAADRLPGTWKLWA
jgi:hypothetical protein